MEGTLTSCHYMPSVPGRNTGQGNTMVVARDQGQETNRRPKMRGWEGGIFRNSFRSTHSTWMPVWKVTPFKGRAQNGSWNGEIILDYLMGLKCHRVHFYEREAEGDWSREVGRWQSEWCGHKPKPADSHQKLPGVGKAFCPRASRGSMA